MLKQCKKLKYIIFIVLSPFFLNWCKRLCTLCYKPTMFNQNVCHVYSSFSDMSCTYSFNWKNKNQIYSHMFFYIATTTGNAYMAQKIPMYRSSHRRCSVRKSVVRNFAKFTGKHLCQSLFFNKVAGMRPGTLLKKRLSFTGVFPWILRNF